jgi:ATP-dependent Clp protease protease subunit
MRRKVTIAVKWFLSMLLLMSCSSCGSINVVENWCYNESFYEWEQSSLARSGKIFLTEGISTATAKVICQKLFALDRDDGIERITLYINSQGGDEQAYIAICDTIDLLQKPVDTVNQAYCLSAACAVHQSATGKRFAYPDAVFGIHTVMSTEKTKDGKQMLERARSLYTKKIRQHSKLPYDWFPLSNRMRYFNAKEALEYEFIDEVLSSNSDEQDIQPTKGNLKDKKI